MHVVSVQAKFGTLTDYFNAVRERKQASTFPVLSGDFFTYADRDDHYWSGYFTSRPFYKCLDRTLESSLRSVTLASLLQVAKYISILISYSRDRSAELLYTAALTEAKRRDEKSFPHDHLMSLLVRARRSLGLYQHHDGVTGTAKDHVVEDYGQR